MSECPLFENLVKKMKKVGKLGIVGLAGPIIGQLQSVSYKNVPVIPHTCMYKRVKIRYKT